MGALCRRLLRQKAPRNDCTNDIRFFVKFYNVVETERPAGLKTPGPRRQTCLTGAGFNVMYVSKRTIANLTHDNLLKPIFKNVRPA